MNRFSFIFRLDFAITLILVAFILPVSTLASSPIISSDPVALTIWQDNSEATRLTISVEDFQFEKVETKNGEFDQIKLKDSPTLLREGWPDLPFISKSVLVPPQSGVRLVINNVEYRVDDAIKPTIAPRIVGEELAEAEPAAEFLNYDGFWPPQPVEMGPPAILRGCRLVNLRYYPAQYNPATGETRFNESVDFDLVYEGEGENTVRNPERPLQSLYAQRALASLVINPPAQPGRDDLNSASYLYVLPNVNGVAAAMAPLIEWRRRQGHRVSVETLQNGAANNVIRDLIRDYYRSDDPVEFVTLVGDATGAISLSASSGTGDFQYTNLDGDDPLSDIALGRLSVTSLDELNRVVNKILTYEVTPDTWGQDFFLRGAVVAGSTTNGLGEVLLAQYVKRELEKIGFTEVRSWLNNRDGNIGGTQPFINDCLTWGVSVFHYRAYHRMNGLDINVLYNLDNRRGPWPPVLAISCNTGTFINEDSYTEAFLKSRGGGIGAVGTATAGTHPQYNNIMAGGVWTAIYKRQMWAFGWGLNGGKYELWRAYNGFDGQYANYLEWNNLMGDAGSIIWSDVPVVPEVEHPASLALGQSRFPVLVTDEDTGDPIPDALVCLYKADDELHLTHYTNAEGIAELRIDPDALTEGDLLVTVTKHNLLPYLNEVFVEEANTFLGLSGLGVDDDEEGQSVGNDNGAANPGEILELRVEYTNFGGTQPEGEVTLELESLSPWAEVLGDPLQFEQGPAGGESDEGVALLRIDPACPDQTVIPLAANISAGGSVWRSMVEIVVDAPKITVENLIFTNGSFNPGDVQRMDVVVRNVGHQALRSSVAQVSASLEMLRVIEDEARYNTIQVNQSGRINGVRFRVGAHPLTIPGMSIPMTLVIETDAGFLDTAFFNIVVGEKDVNDPLGPDRYGYVCFDSGDRAWELAPTYNWVEIDPNAQNHNFRGTALQLNDRGDNQDVSARVDLPFDFQYYGEVFAEITICSNGWAAFGNQTVLADFRNRQIGQALGPDAQLCAWWDNLKMVNNSAILYHYDRNGGRFIIEWNAVARLLDGGGTGASETFEIILYDPAVHETMTGDGMILFQYKAVTNEASPARNDTPYCTIGIGNLDDSDGIQYTYWNTYPPGARRIANEMALLFVTQTDFRTGILEGFVTNFQTGEPIEGAQIVSSRSFWAETDAEGHYIIDNILVDEGYSVTVSCLGWNDSTLTGIDITEDDVTRVDFMLLHPEFTPTEDSFVSRLPVGEQQQFPFSVTNTGNGPLFYSTSKTLRDEANAVPWERRSIIQAGQITGDSRISGVVFAEGRFYVAGAYGQDGPAIYVLDRDGNLERQFPQQVASRYGMRDMAWDGEWLWGSGERTVYAVNLDGEVMRQFAGPWDPNSCMTWDTERQVLWISSTTQMIVAMDRDGNEIRRIDRRNLRMYGFGYWPEDPDGYSLYIYHRNTDVADQMVTKMNPDNADTLFVTTINNGLPGTPYACNISNQFDVYSWVLITIVNNGADDRIEVWQLDSRKDWFNVEPEMGTLNCGEAQDFTLTLDAAGLPEVPFEGDLIFNHNAFSGETRLSVRLEVLPGIGQPAEQTVAMDAGWNLISLNITPEALDITELMRPLVEAGLLNLIKDGFGRYYSPAHGFSNMEEWSVLQGYQINLSAASEWTVQGVSEAADAPIPLQAGWNMTSYLPHVPVDAVIALSSIRDRLDIAKDGWGRFYMPEFGFSNMGDLAEGFGYQIKVTEAVELVYNTDQRRAAQPETPPAVSRFPMAKQTGSNMSALLKVDPSLKGGEIAVKLSDGQIVGTGRINPQGWCGLAVWGDDPASAAIDGATEGAELSFVIMAGVVEKGADVAIRRGEAVWRSDGLLVGELTVVVPPAGFGLAGIYPNPFNSVTRIDYYLVDAGQVNLRLYDTSGRLVMNVVDAVIEAGRYNVFLDGSKLAAGLYFIKLESAGRVDYRKMALMK